MVDWVEFAGNVLLFFLVFGMSATVDVNSVRKQIRNTKAILIGIFCQFVILPMLGFFVVKLLRLGRAIGMTLLVVTSSPGGSYSNWWCSMFNADLALSVTMTAISTVISTAMLPLNLLLYAKLSYHGNIVEKLDWGALFLALFIVMSAITAGVVCSHNFKSRKFNRIANHCGNVAGATLIIFSATMASLGSSSENKIWSQNWTFFVGVSLPCILGLFLSNLLAYCLGLMHPERVTVAIECCYQNVGIATSIALAMFDGNAEKTALGVPVLYGAVEAICVGAFCILSWKLSWTKAPSDAPFWRILLTSYEVIEAQQKDLAEVEISMSESEEPLNDVLDASGNSILTYFQLAPTPSTGKQALRANENTPVDVGRLA